MPRDQPSALSTSAAAAAALAALAWWTWSRRRRALLELDQWALVVCAVREEACFVEARLTRSHEVALAPAWRRVRGWIGGLQVDVLTCGIGEVDAASATTAALLSEPRRPVAALSVGCSGAHRPEVRPGDVVLGAAVVPTACKMVRADGSSEHVGQRLTTSASPLAELRADAHLLGLARAAALQAALPPWPTTPGRVPAVHEGKVGSSDVWTQQVEEIERQAALGTYCEEMEAHGVARACAAFGVPLLAIKDVANNELTPASLAEAQLVEMAVCPAGGQRPIRLPGPSEGSGRSYAPRSAA